MLGDSNLVVDEPKPAFSSTPQQQIVSQPDPVKKFPLKIILSVIILIALGAGGVFAYVKVFNSPEVILQKMIRNTMDLKSANVKSVLNIRLSGDGGDSLAAFLGPERTFNVDFNISSTGSFEITETEGIKSSNNIIIKTVIPPIFSFDGSIDLINLGRVFYLRVNDAPFSALVDLADKIGIWIEFNADKPPGGAGVPIESKTGSLNNIVSEITEEQKLQIKEKVASLEIFKILEDMEKEKVNEVETYHYRIGLDRDSIVDFLRFFNEEIVSEEERIPEIEFEEEMDKLKKIDEGDTFKNLMFDVWIGKRDKFLHKFTFSMDVAVEDLYTSGGNKIETTIFSESIISDHNKPMSILAPIEYKTLEEILMETLPMSSEKDSDNDGLSDSIESSIGTDPNNPDTDGDGYSDGSEVADGYNPLGPGSL